MPPSVLENAIGCDQSTNLHSPLPSSHMVLESKKEEVRSEKRRGRNFRANREIQRRRKRLARSVHLQRCKRPLFTFKILWEFWNPASKVGHQFLAATPDERNIRWNRKIEGWKWKIVEIGEWLDKCSINGTRWRQPFEECPGTEIWWIWNYGWLGEEKFETRCKYGWNSLLSRSTALALICVQ